MTVLTDFAKVISGPGARAAVPPERSLGALLMDAGKITAEDAERILRFSREKRVRFGDAAVALKLVTADEIQHCLAQQFDYPYLSPGEGSVSVEVAAAWAPFSHQVEALRALRTQLLIRWFTDERKSLAVVSAGRGEGRSHLAANLAVVFSQMGERTLLVDADLRNPRQHALFGLSNATGLSTILADRASLEAIHRIPSFVDLSVLTAGAEPPNPLELLGRESFGATLAECSARFDVVIVDTPAASLGSDGHVIAAKSNGAIVLARAHRSRLDACRELASGLRASGVTLVGSVLNDC